MKKLSILAATGLATANLGLATLAAPAFAADATTLTQANFTSALSSLGTEVNGVTCSSTSASAVMCHLNAGNYILDENINISPSSPTQSNILGLDQNVTIDLNNKTFTGTNYAMVIQDAEVTLKNGTVTTSSAGTAILSSGTSTTSNNLTLDNITAPSGSTVMLGLGTATFNNCTIGHFEAFDDGILVVNGGTYGDDDATNAGSAANLANVNVTINGGTFKASQASAIYAMQYMSSEGVTLTINGGTFTSADDNGIEFETYKSVNINGGTFAGKKSGIALPYNSDFTISGGTFKATGAGELNAAIRVSGTADTSNAENLLAANYRYTNASVVPKTIAGLGGGDYLLIGGAETSVVANSSASTTGSSSTDAGISAPKSGVMTSEASSAAASLAPAAIVALGGVTAFALTKAKKED